MNQQTIGADGLFHTRSQQSFNSTCSQQSVQRAICPKDAIAAAAGTNSSKQTAPVTCCVRVSLGSGQHTVRINQLNGQTARIGPMLVGSISVDKCIGACLRSNLLCLINFSCRCFTRSACNRFLQQSHPRHCSVSSTESTTHCLIENQLFAT